MSGRPAVRDPDDRRLATAAGRLLSRVEHWEAPRWSQPAEPDQAGQPSRAELVHALVQRLADLAAAAEGRPAQPVPRLDHDLSLPDQLKVMVADLRQAGASPETLRAAAADIEATAARL